METNLINIIARRVSCRAYKSDPVPQEHLVHILEAARLAPSACNKQPWRFVAVQEKTLLEKIQGTFSDGNYWAKKAPMVIAAWTHLDYDARTPDGREFALFDLGQAVMALQVQVQTEGLVSHPFAGFDANKAKEILGLPDGAILPVLITVAHLGDDKDLGDKHKELEHSARSRVPLADVVSFR